MQYYSVYVTTEDEDEAMVIGRILVEEKLAACVNIHPMFSIYWWQGDVQEDTEVALLVKTKAGLVDEVINRVKQLHSQEVPCIVAWPIEKGNPDYLKWVEESTR